MVVSTPGRYLQQRHVRQQQRRIAGRGQRDRRPVHLDRPHVVDRIDVHAFTSRASASNTVRSRCSLHAAGAVERALVHGSCGSRHDLSIGSLRQECVRGSLVLLSHCSIVVDSVCAPSASRATRVQSDGLSAPAVPPIPACWTSAGCSGSAPLHGRRPYNGARWRGEIRVGASGWWCSSGIGACDGIVYPLRRVEVPAVGRPEPPAVRREDVSHGGCAVVAASSSSCR